MKKFLFLTVILYMFSFSMYSQKKPITNIFLDKLKNEYRELNKNLPKQSHDGVWLWSSLFKDKTVILTYKVDQHKNPAFSSSFIAEMISEYEKGLVNMLEEDAPLIAKNGVSFKLVYLSLENNSLIYEILVTPQKIQKYYNQLQQERKMNKGNKPLSYYRQGFISAYSNLPVVVDDYTILFKVSMPDTTVFYDHYLDDDIAEYIKNDISGISKAEMEKEMASSFNNQLTKSPEMRSDLKTYGIKLCYRFYYSSTKTLAFQIIVDPSVDCK